MFSTRVTGTVPSRSACAAGSALLPTLMSSSALPTQAASIRARSIPASASASRNASTINPSAPTSQRSPNRVQPMPTMATLSANSRGHQASLQHGPHQRGRFPEVGAKAEPAVLCFDAQPHPHPVADAKAFGGAIDHFHQHAGAVIELDKAEVERRIRTEVEPVGCDRNDRRFKIGQPHVLHLFDLRQRPDSTGKALLGNCTLPVLSRPADETDHIAPHPFENSRLRLLLEFGAHAPIKLERTGEAEEARVAREHLSFLERRRHGARPGTRLVTSNTMASAPLPKPTSSTKSPTSAMSSARPSPIEGVGHAQIAGYFGNRFTMIGGLAAQSLGHCAPDPTNRFMHGGVGKLPGTMPAAEQAARTTGISTSATATSRTKRSS